MELTEAQRAALANPARYQQVLGQRVYSFLTAPPHPHPHPGFLPERASWVGSMHPHLSGQITGCMEPWEILARGSGKRPRREVLPLARVVDATGELHRKLLAEHELYLQQQQQGEEAA